MIKPIVISLLEQKERKNYIKNKFPNCEFFNAIDGRKFKLKHALLNPEAVACFLSHTTLHLQLLNREDEYFLIFEDDVKPIVSLDEIQNKIVTLPNDWDIAFLGWFSEKREIDNQKTINKDWMIINSFWGFQSYLIKKSSIIKIYENLLNIDDHIDIQIARQIKYGNINGYFLINPIISQSNFETQIPKRKVIE